LYKVIDLQSDGPTKDQCRRIARQRRGVNRLNSGLPSLQSAALAEDAAHQAARLRGRPEETEALTFIDTAFAWPPI
jgi:hypothetical protein